jgi:hypothetical protein
MIGFCTQLEEEFNTDELEDELGSRVKVTTFVKVLDNPDRCSRG